MPSKIQSHIEEQGYMDRRIGQTFFRRLMPIGPRRGTPLFILHGGPGSTHETYHQVLSLADDREVVIYDQIGCGRSSSLKSREWTLETFVQELEDLRLALGYKKIDLLGHSWGGMLAAEYYFTYPKNVRAIVFSSPCLDARQWSVDAQRLLKKLPVTSQRAVQKGLRTRNYSAKAFKQAEEIYYDKFVRRFVAKGEKRPHAMKLGAAGFAFDGYMKMWGPVEFIATGSLKSFNRAKDLPRVKIPTLFTCGRYDEATPETIGDQASRTPGAKFHVFERSSHLATLEQPREYVRKIGAFLRSVDAR